MKLGKFPFLILHVERGAFAHIGEGDSFKRNTCCVVRGIVKQLMTNVLACTASIANENRDLTRNDRAEKMV